nr:MBOAT family O-acyltransferase [Teredinibacter haidensis]
MFLPAVLLIYRYLNLRCQNIFLVGASYFFYGWWDWRFLGLILISTVVDYFCGRSIYFAKNKHDAKRFVLLSIVVNISILMFFKYFNFFSDSFTHALSLIGYSPSWFEVNVVLPVGISFYTFQTITYSVDVYRRRVKATHSFVDFSLFVSFFPQLVAGPIETASSLLPQIQNPRKIVSYNYTSGGVLILWGLVKKVFIADNLSTFVDASYSNYASLSAVEVALVSVAFACQIYCDFSGYSDIARGTARLLGFELRLNFNLPYFAKNPSDFWRRWHMSLSDWLKQYLYISMGGNRKGTLVTYRNLMLTMLLGGLWHGAAWTFVMWGAYHGFLLCAHRYISSNFKLPTNKYFSICSVFLMFIFTCYGWLIFRCDSFRQLAVMTSRLFSTWGIGWEKIINDVEFVGGYIWPLILIQLLQFITKDMSFYLKFYKSVQHCLIALGIYLLFVYGSIQSPGFIYFQF